MNQTINFREFTSQIPGGVIWGSNGEGQIHCPFHEDSTPSCSINIEKEVFHCHGCGEKGTLRALLAHCGLIPNQSNNGDQTLYDYTDQDGKLAYQVVRFYKDGKKTFFCRRPDGRGDWINNLTGISPMLYKLPAVAWALSGKEPVIVVEGEKDADKLASRGFAATCNHGGAGKWRAAHAKPLKGAVVYLCGDSDEPGIKHMQQVGCSLMGVASTIRMIDLGYPVTASHGKDISDWLGEGHTKEEFQIKLDEAVEFVPPEQDEENAEEQESIPGGYPYNLTDGGNSEVFISVHGNDILYCHAWKEWLIWNGNHWSVDRSERVISLALETCRHLYQIAPREATEKRKESLAVHALRSESRPKLTSMLLLAQRLRPVTPEKLDTDPLLLGLPNGVLDLRSLHFREPDRDDLITKETGVAFDEKADCPRFKQFLFEIFDGSMALSSYIQRIIGYCLTGLTDEQCIFIPFGGGENGKSTFIETMVALFGDYSMTMRPEVLMLGGRADGERATPAMARLPGVRFLSSIESQEGRKLNEALIKQMSGGDTISARKLYSKNFDFVPNFKLFLATNHLPEIQGTDHAIWRRLQCIPFNVRFDGNNKDLKLKNKLLLELPGILNWAIEGCRMWQKDGLNPPSEVERATGIYRGLMDILVSFIDDCLIQEFGMKTRKSDLFRVYLTWCARNGEHPQSQRELSIKLSERGFKSGRSGQLGHFWEDTGAKDEWQNDLV